MENNICNMPEKICIKNVSTGGLCVVTDSELAPGTVVEGEIDIKGMSEGPFRAFCQAVWSRKSGPGGCYDTGMKFLGVKEQDMLSLVSFVNRASMAEVRGGASAPAAC